MGVSNQEAAARELAAQHGLDVVSVYTDNDVSASTNSRKPRPGFDAMREAAQRGEFDTVIAYSMSRLTRRPAEWEGLIELAQSHGVNYLYKVSPRYDLNTADGRATARTVAAWDAAEAERTSERRKERNDRQVGKGIPAGRPRVFGFEPDGMTPRESEAAMIRAAYESILDGAPVREVARAWNAAGARSVRGGEWSAVTVRNSLLRERNAGILVANGQWQPVSQITPIVDLETWETARAILTTSRPERQGRPSADRFLSGIAECSCGEPMVVGASWSRGNYAPAYVCRQIAHASRTPGHKTPAGHARIKAELAELAIPDEVVVALAYRSPVEQVTPQRRNLIAQRSAVAEQVERAKQLYAEFGGADDLARVRRLQAELEDLTSRIDALAADSGHAAVVAAARAVLEQVDAAIASVTSDVAEDAFERQLRDVERARAAFDEHWRSLGVEERRGLVRGTLAVVRINPPGSDRPRIETTPRGGDGEGR